MKQKKRFFVSLLSAVLLTLLASSGLLTSPDNALSDALYQASGSPGTDIVVIGIDQPSLDALGSWPWPRSIMAEAIRSLNADPDNLPAVIGIDILYTEEGLNSEADRLLVDAAEQGGNVVFASYLDVHSDLSDYSDGIYLPDVGKAVLISPFAALHSVSDSGIINAFPDADGILRHVLLADAASGSVPVFSFPRVVYERFCSAAGISPLPPPAVSGTNAFYLPFSAAGGAYCDGINMASLLSGNFPQGFFRDKIVLIGPYSVGLQDRYLTSLDHAAPMYGVDIHANTIEAFQKGFFPREVSAHLQEAVLFLLLFALAFFFWKRKVLLSLVLWLGISTGWVGLCKFCYLQGRILQVLRVPVGVTALFLGSVIFNFIRTQAEKHRIDETFGHYIAPEIKKQLLAGGVDSLSLGGQTQDVAVLFVDIRGFTAMSEQLDAQTVVEILNRYLTLATNCIIKNRGTLDKFVGDCAMALWNTPLPQEDSVYLACRAAVDMVAGSESLSEDLQSRFGRTVSFGIGINWGPAVIGNIGAPQRMDYTAIGDTVNTAARLESSAPGGTIFISRAVADRLGERAVVTSLGTGLKLKGKAEGFEVLRLESLL